MSAGAQRPPAEARGRARAVGVGHPKSTRFVVSYELAGDPCRRALHRPVAQIVAPTAADVGALVETLLAQGAVRLHVHREEVTR